MEPLPFRRPGDLLLDRYFPDDDIETRERAREAFREFAGILEAFGEAIWLAASDSRESPTRDNIESSPP